MNLAQNEEISLEADYWTPRLTECIALGEKVYFATGDIVTTITKNVYCMHYNKNMINARDLENPYDLVKSNQWTWEKLFQMSKDIYVDTDADEKKDDYSEWDDTYGLVIAGQGPIDAMYLSAGMTLIEKDAEGYYSVSPDYRGDRASSFMSFVREFRTSNDCCYANTGSFVNFPDCK